MKRLLFLSLLFLIPSVARAQVPVVSVLPANCSVGQQVSFLGTVYTCTAKDTWTPGASGISLPTTLSAPGVFTNTQMNLNWTVNINGCSPATVFNAAHGASFKATEANDGCITIPSGAPTGLWGNAFGGYAVNNSPNGDNTPGVVFSATAQASAIGAHVWAFNSVVFNSSAGATQLAGDEQDIVPGNTGDVGFGFGAFVFGNTQAASLPAFSVRDGDGLAGRFTSGLLITAGSVAASAPSLANVGRGVELDPTTSAAGSNSSSGIFFVAQASDSTQHTLALFTQSGTGSTSPLALDVMSPDSTNGGRINQVAILGNHNFTTGISPGNLLTFSTCTLSSGTCSYTFTTAYTSPPLCTATWNGTGTLTGIIKAVPGTASVAVTSSVGTDTAAVNISCGPQAN